MTCASCAGRVERALAQVPGVLEASVNLATERARVRSAGTPAVEALVAAVQAAGYSARRPQADADATGQPAGDDLGGGGTPRDA